MNRNEIDDLGPQIRLGRQEKGFTQQHVADCAGVSRQLIVALEAGVAPTVSYRTVLRVMQICGLDLRVGTYNHGRPTLDDIQRERDAEEAAEREAERRAGYGGPRFR